MKIQKKKKIEGGGPGGGWGRVGGGGEVRVCERRIVFLVKNIFFWRGVRGGVGLVGGGGVRVDVNKELKFL